MQQPGVTAVQPQSGQHTGRRRIVRSAGAAATGAGAGIANTKVLAFGLKLKELKQANTSAEQFTGPRAQSARRACCCRRDCEMLQTGEAHSVTVLK